jgi:uncharacterized repeat protein (TIGR01451 family)
VITIQSGVDHRVINGRFGFVLDFLYPAEIDVSSVVGTEPQLLARSGNSDVLVALEDPNTGVRTVSQDFLAVDGSNDSDSLSERKRLFQNAVWWLLRYPICDLTDLVIGETASINPAQTGQPLTYTLTLQRSGECEATGVIVTDVLPPGVKFVSANTPQGTWTEGNGVVTFHLGAMQEVFIQLTVTVTPTQPGSITNVVRIRGNESEQSISNNSASLALQVQGNPVTANAQSVGAAPRAIFFALRSADDLMSLQVQADLGTEWILESSNDLVHWTAHTRFTVTAPVIEVTSPLQGQATFYRLRAANSSSE